MTTEFTDRYKALGIPYPDTKTVCRGQCEGTGYIPHYKGNGEVQPVRQEGDDALDILWDEAHAKPHKKEQEIIKNCGKHQDGSWNDCKDCVTADCDGWHFLKCPDCNGTGKITIPNQDKEV